MGEKGEKNQRGRKEKKKPGEVSREVFWEGEKGARQPLGERYFFYLTPFFAFFPLGGAWSQANSKAIFTRLVGVTFIGAVTEALTITRGKRGGVRWAGYLQSFSIISLLGAPSLKNFQISFCKILKNK